MGENTLITVWNKVNEVADHLAPRVVTCMFGGAGIGVCHSHIQGKPMVAGTLPFVAVGAFGGTAFFATQKILELSRGKDDVWNYGISGAFNGAWIGAGLGGLRRGLISACLLSSIAVAGKYAADSASESLSRRWADVKDAARQSNPEGAPSRGPTLKEKQIAMFRKQQQQQQQQQQQAAQQRQPETDSSSNHR